MNRGPEERIYLDKHQVCGIVREISLRRHVERYTMLRQWCHGIVVDCACGCGYGSYLISENPDVSKVYAVDISKDAITWAKDNFISDKLCFIQSSVQDFSQHSSMPIDVLVSVETIEHIENTDSYFKAVLDMDPKEVIVSFPSKKSTHFNRYHYHDFTEEEVTTRFHACGYFVVDSINLNYELCLLRLKKP